MIGRPTLSRKQPFVHPQKRSNAPRFANRHRFSKKTDPSSTLRYLATDALPFNHDVRPNASAPRNAKAIRQCSEDGDRTS